MSDITSEIKKRRTFAIISHPDAGKTTLTEKFLLYGGAINLAGSVKGKKNSKACGFRLDGDRKGERYLGYFPQYSSLTMTDTVSISLIHRDMRTSQRILTEHLWQQIQPSW